MIWEHVAQHPRDVFVNVKIRDLPIDIAQTCKENIDRHSVTTGLATSLVAADLYFSPESPTPAILCTCSESRATGLQNYDLKFSQEHRKTPREGRFVYANAMNDTLFMKFGREGGFYAPITDAFWDRFLDLTSEEDVPQNAYPWSHRWPWQNGRYLGSCLLISQYLPQDPLDIRGRMTLTIVSFPHNPLHWPDASLGEASYDFLPDKIRGESYTPVLGAGEVWYVGKVTINMSGDLFFRCFVVGAREWCDDVPSLPDFLDPFHEMPLPRICTPPGVVDEIWSWP